MNAFAKITAALGLVALFSTSAVFAQGPMTAKAPATATTSTGTHVKGYTKTLKSGKMVTVKGYNRMAKPMPKMTHVKGYTKTMKNGKTITVKGYSRKAPAKGPVTTAPKM